MSGNVTYISTRSCWHPLGSASMLPKEEGGVVDKDLIVYGTNNLRVVSISAYYMVAILEADIRV